MNNYLLPLTLNQLHALRMSVDRTMLDISAQHEAAADHNLRCQTPECAADRSDFIFLSRVLKKIDDLMGDD